MKKVIAALKKYYHLIVFDVFFLVEAYGLMAVPLTGDDYYFGSFTRGGIASFFAENAKIYMNSDGHIAANVFTGIFARLPLTVWRVLTLIAVGAIVWLCAGIAAGEDKKRFPASLTLATVGFAALDLAVLRETVFHVTGAVGFVFPLLLVLVLYRVYAKAIREGRGAWYVPVLAFVCALWSEQAAIAATVICVVLTVCGYVWNKGIKVTHIMAFPAALLGLAVLLLSPGAAASRSYYAGYYAMGLVGRIKSTFVGFFQVAFGTGGMLFFFVIFFILAGFAAIRRIVKAGKDTSPLRLGLDALLIIFPLMSAIAIVVNSPLVPTLYVRIGVVSMLTVVSCALILADAVCALIAKKDGTMLTFLLCAGASFIWVMLRPGFSGRYFLFPAVLLLVPAIKYAFTALEVKAAMVIVPVCVSLYAACIVTAWHTLALAVLVYAAFLIALMTPAKKLNAVVAVCAALCMVMTVAYGYNLNRGVNYRNVKATEAVVSGEDTDGVLTLAESIAPGYEYRPLKYSAYHQNWFREYYGIPEDVELEFLPAADITDW